MSSIKEVFRVLSDVARVLPVTLAKQPTSDDAVSIALVFEATVARQPDSNMIVFEGREITWGDFNELANTLAHALMDRGVKRDDCVAVIMENRIEMLACIIALQKIGAIAGMVNPGLVGAQLAHCINVTKSVKCLAGEEIFSSVMDVRADLDMEDKDILWVADLRESSAPEPMEDIMSHLQQYPTTNLEDTKTILAGATGFYIFTSGTTGMPKAAKGRAEALVSRGWTRLVKRALEQSQRDRMYLVPASLSRDRFHLWGQQRHISVAPRCFYVASSQRRRSGQRFKNISALSSFYVGELCRYLVTQPPCPEELNNPLDPSLWQRPASGCLGRVLRTRFGIDRVCEFYGSSEGNVSFFNAFNKDKTIGFCPGTILLVEYDIEQDEIVLDQNGKYIQVESGKPGLLLAEIDDRYRFDGYTDSAASESKTLRDVLMPGDAWFNTGDLITEVDVGFAMGKPHYQFVDRIGDTFRWRSENVSTNEVGEILNANEQVEIANVYGVDVPAAEGKAGMASLALNPGCVFDPVEFSAYVTS